MQNRENVEIHFKWHVQNSTPIILEEWDEGAVAYNSKSGTTHQLNKLALDVLKSILQQPISLDTLTDYICTIYAVEDRNDLDLQLRKLISQFDNLGLIEPFSE